MLLNLDAPPGGGWELVDLVEHLRRAAAESCKIDAPLIQAVEIGMEDEPGVED